jgi:hypothetical protein
MKDDFVYLLNFVLQKSPVLDIGFGTEQKYPPKSRVEWLTASRQFQLIETMERISD